MNQVKISIIIVHFGEIEVSKECLESLKKMNRPNFRLILVDNSPAKNNQEIFTNIFSDIIYLANACNVGFASATNQGIIKALELNSDYLFILNNDTLVNNNTLKVMIENAEQFANVGIITCRIMQKENPEIIWYDGGKFNTWKCRGEHFNIYKSASSGFSSNMEVDFVSGCCFLIKSKVIDQIGMLDERFFAYDEDLDYCIRVKEKKIKMMYLPSVFIYHRVSSSFSKSRQSMTKFIPVTYYYKLRNRIYIMRKHSSFYIVPVNLFFIFASFLRYVVGFILFIKFDELKLVVKALIDGFTISLEEK